MCLGAATQGPGGVLYGVCQRSFHQNTLRARSEARRCCPSLACDARDLPMPLAADSLANDRGEVIGERFQDGVRGTFFICMMFVARLRLIAAPARLLACAQPVSANRRPEETLTTTPRAQPFEPPCPPPRSGFAQPAASANAGRAPLFQSGVSRPAWLRSSFGLSATGHSKRANES